MSIVAWIERHLSSFVEITGCLPGKIVVNKTLATRLHGWRIDSRGAVCTVDDLVDDPDTCVLLIQADTPLRLTMVQTIDCFELDSFR